MVLQQPFVVDYAVDGTKDSEGYVTDIAAAAERSTAPPLTEVLKTGTVAAFPAGTVAGSCWYPDFAVPSRWFPPAGYCAGEASRKSGH